MPWPPFIDCTTHSGSSLNYGHLWREVSVGGLCVYGDVMREIVRLENGGVGCMLEAEIALRMVDIACPESASC